MRPKLSNRGAAVLIWGALAMAVVTAGAPQGQAQMAYVESGEYLICTDSWCFPNVYWTVVTPFGRSDGLYDTEPAWSPDATKIAFVRDGEIFVADAAFANTLTITNGGYFPAWSPDGARIAFVSGELYLMNPDGSGVVRLTYGVALSVWDPAWSPDGGRIAFSCVVENGNSDICAINPDGTGFVRLTTDPAQDSGPTWSPDGSSIAFATNRFNGSSFAVMNPDGTGVAQLGTGVFGSNPAWSPDGAKIAFEGSFGGIYTMSADGTNVALFANSADEPAWMPARVPVATFRFACNGTTCNFDASASRDSYGTITSYAWSFGDQTTATGASVTHTYASGGAYSARLTVTDNNGATGTKFQIIPINPVAAFTFSCSGLKCNFDASSSKDSSGPIISFDWNFGDGASSSGVTTSHTFAFSNSYIVTLTVTDSIGATGTQTKAVTVTNSPPVASFTFSCNLLACTFNGSGSRDSDGTIGSYVWNFGDGTTGSGLTVSHTYPAGGQYTVTLTVTDNLGSSNTQGQTVVANSPPVASFTFSCSKFTCSFDASASRDSDGTITSYAWKFGDGTTGSGPTVSHTYKAPPDTYTVTLTVTDNLGATGAQSNSITVIHRK
jgi:PKD repeat protein